MHFFMLVDPLKDCTYLENYNKIVNFFRKASVQPMEFIIV